MKRNEYAEPTEMAGIAEADTEMAYAWALDYDDPDEFPTGQRLTPRRITALSLAASLVVIAVAGGWRSSWSATPISLSHRHLRPLSSRRRAQCHHLRRRLHRRRGPDPTERPWQQCRQRGHVRVSLSSATSPLADIPGGRPTNEELVALRLSGMHG